MSADPIHPESYGHWDHAQISELLHERDRLREEGKKDYEGMREFQRKFIDACHEVSKYKVRLQVMRAAWRETDYATWVSYDCPEAREWFDADGVPT